MAIKSTDEAVQLQAAAMHSEVFEIGLFDPNSRRQMLPRVWDRHTLLRSISWLRLKNGRGRNIYVRPSGEHRLTLLNDIGWRTVGRLKEEGFEPAVIVETSPGNFQAWLNHGEVLAKEFSTFVARVLARRFLGDPASADWRHFGRLAGFTNRKEKYRKENGLYPFVVLHEATGRAYRRSPGGDQTRSDLAYAIYALAHNIPETTLREQLASRDLSHKGNHKRQQEYLDRTVLKARIRIREDLTGVSTNSSNRLPKSTSAGQSVRT